MVLTVSYVASSAKSSVSKNTVRSSVNISA
jgi:hypothetical protein